MKKMLIIVLCVTLCIVFTSITVFAIPDVDLYKPSSDMPNEITNIGNRIIGVVQFVGTIFAVAMLVWLGIRLMLASPSERADIKSRAVPYIVGAVMLFSIVNLLKIVYDIMQGI